MINGAAALAELIRPARDAGEFGTQRALPVLPALSSLLPHRGLRRGSTIAIGITPGPAVHQDALPPAGPRDLGEFGRGARPDSPRSVPGAGATAVGSGSTSLLLGLLAAASSAGSWCAVVGVPTLGALAAAESGIALDRLALVPNPGPEWPTVVAALIDGVDVVVIAVPGQVAASIAGRLVARARQRGCVLVPYGRWDGADVTLQVTQGRWEGLGAGHGRLRRRKVTVVARGRGTAARPKEITMWMPGLAAAPPRNPAPGTAGPPRDLTPGAPEPPRDPAPSTPERSRFRPVAVPPPASATTAEEPTPAAAGPLAAVRSRELGVTGEAPAPAATGSFAGVRSCGLAAADDDEGPASVNAGTLAAVGEPLASVTPIMSAGSASERFGEAPPAGSGSPPAAITPDVAAAAPGRPTEAGCA